MPNKHFMRVSEVARESSSVERVVCRVHPNEALVVKEQKSTGSPGERTIVVQCPACLKSARSHEERERCTMTLARELHGTERPASAFRAAS